MGKNFGALTLVLACNGGCSSESGTAVPGTAGDASSPSPDVSAIVEDAEAGDGPIAANAPDAALGHTGAGDAGVAWWKPGTEPLPWQWEIDHPVKTTSAADMGTGGTTYAGVPAAAPVVYDVDGFNSTAADVAALHALGKKVIGYIEVGASESYRADYARFPVAALGSVVGGYPNERYLNINDPTVVEVVRARIAMCAKKGFDGIEPDIDDSYSDGTGFTITRAQNVAYLAALSDYAHSQGVAWGLKNGGDGGDPSMFVPSVLPYVDFAVVEEPFYLKTIGFYSPAFINAGKGLFVAEYAGNTSSASTFCPNALNDHFNAALFAVALDGTLRTACE